MNIEVGENLGKIRGLEIWWQQGVRNLDDKVGRDEVDFNSRVKYSMLHLLVNK